MMPSEVSSTTLETKKKNNEEILNSMENAIKRTNYKEEDKKFLLEVFSILIESNTEESFETKTKTLLNNLQAEEEVFIEHFNNLFFPYKNEKLSINNQLFYKLFLTIFYNTMIQDLKIHFLIFLINWSVFDGENTNVFSMLQHFGIIIPKDITIIDNPTMEDIFKDNYLDFKKYKKVEKKILFKFLSILNLPITSWKKIKNVSFILKNIKTLKKTLFYYDYQVFNKDIVIFMHSFFIFYFILNWDQKQIKNYQIGIKNKESFLMKIFNLNYSLVTKIYTERKEPIKLLDYIKENEELLKDTDFKKFVDICENKNILTIYDYIKYYLDYIYLIGIILFMIILILRKRKKKL